MLGIGLPDRARGAVAGALADAGVHAGVRGSALRVSPHLWTTDQDVERLVGALTMATTGMVAS
jgi:selenocysteine lyase/cysteine desulfurase